jgi:hypothetical protein
MNWEESKALTPLKRDFLNAFFERSQAFFLTGGSALGIFYLQHRLSFDLDFFTTDEHLQWHILDNELRALSRTLGAHCTSVTTSPTFRRYDLRRHDEREKLDFVIEQVPQIDSEKARFGQLRVDTLREIMVNKICTLIGRCEIKDLVDLFFLAKRGFVVWDYLQEARRKEGGLDPAMISFILARTRIDAIPDYILEPVSAEELVAFVRDLQRRLSEMAFPEMPA